MASGSSSQSEKGVFHFFDDLIIRGGLTRLKKAFRSDEHEDSSSFIRYNSESNSLEGIEYDVETDEWQDYSLSFDKYLFQYLKPEFDRVKGCIDQDFRSKEFEEGARSLSRYYFGQLNRLLNGLSRYNESEGRELTKMCLNRLIEEVEVRRDAILEEESGSSVKANDGRVTHAQNSEWVAEKWKELRRKNPNATQSDLIAKVAAAYREEFGRRPPSDRSIRRYIKPT